MIFEIARSLLEVERKHFKSNRRTGLFDEFENIFRKSFYNLAGKNGLGNLDHFLAQQINRTLL